MNMRTVTKYVCSVCGMECPDKREAMAHEGAHFGLTEAEYGRWRDLREGAADAGRRSGQTNNADTRAAFDAAVKALTDFEFAHGLAGRDQPINV